MAEGTTRARPSAPKPWKQREARTTFLRVPYYDWVAVRRGDKTEFRGSGNYVSQLWNVACPSPIVAWTSRAVNGYESQLMVLTGCWQEPLGGISAESLAREGFESFAHFRRYWMGRTKQRFNPMREVVVYRLRPITPDDLPKLGLQLLHRLYGEHIPCDS